MEGYFERLYRAGLALKDYNKTKPLVDEVDRLSEKLLKEHRTLSYNAIDNIMVKVKGLQREILASCKPREKAFRR